MKNTDFINELNTRALDLRAKSPQLRYGQALMNVLSEMDLDLYHKVSAKDAVDPFFSDAKITAFFAFLSIDDIIWTLADHYLFTVTFCDLMQRFVITSNIPKFDANFHWTSDETTERFLDGIREFFSELGVMWTTR